MRKLIFIICILLFSCAKTEISSFKDPVDSSTKYEAIFVAAAIPDVEDRKYLEQNMCSELINSGYKCIPSIDHILSTRQYTPEDIDRILSRTGTDGILLLELSGSEEKARSTSRPVYNSFEKKWEYVSDTYNQPFIYFKMQLIDVHENRTIWTGTSKTKGNRLANKEDLLNSLSETTIKGLKEDGVL